MPAFMIYELEQTLSAIRFTPQNVATSVSFGNMTQEKLVEDNIKSRTLLISFLRMSSKRKMAMLTKMFQSVRNLRTLADILNTFVSVNTKLMTYSKISSDSNSSYEQFVQDHDRMLDQDALEEMVLDNTEWFTTLGDAAQTDIITTETGSSKPP